MDDRSGGARFLPRLKIRHQGFVCYSDEASISLQLTPTVAAKTPRDSDILLASPPCTSHSLAKGARRRKPQAASVFDDGPAGDAEQDRSRATMWDVCRFAEQKQLKGCPYKAMVVENVVDAFRWGANDDGALFVAWLTAMRALGYEHEIVWLNSMFAHGRTAKQQPAP
jgi:DNA (cytosine-5)-methyltransferase 1